MSTAYTRPDLTLIGESTHMDELEELQIKAEIDEIARKVEMILQRVETEDPGRPPTPEADAQSGNAG